MDQRFYGCSPRYPGEKWLMQIRLSWRYFWSLRGSKEGPLINDTLPQEGDLVGNIGKMVLWGLIFFSAMEKKTKPNLIILLVFLVAMGLWGGPLG